MLSLEPVIDIRVSRSLTVCSLVELYGLMHGFTSSSIYEAFRVLSEGLESSDLRIISFTGNLIATGLRGVISQLISSKLFNVVFTTTGAIDHDIARSLGGLYLKGYFEVDDSKLRDLGFQRLGNVFIPVDSYGLIIENFTRRLVEEAIRIKREWGIYEILRLAGDMIRDENSILRSASKAKVDIFVPGWPDGAFGTSLFMEKQRGQDIIVDYFIDMKRLSDIFFTAKKATALIIGGGISKHHVLWWSQFREGLDYAIYITTAQEYDGSLSGAKPREAISWGKIRQSAKTVVIYGDATLILPIITSCIVKD